MVENDQDKLDWIYALFDFTFEGMKKVYGIPIKEILLREGRNDIPFVVEHLISFLEKSSMEVEGIFRLSGTAFEVKSLISTYDSGKEVDLNSIEDIHTITGALKAYFRDLPDPLLTFDLYEQLIKAASTIPEDDKLAAHIASNLLGSLPRENRIILNYLLSFLNKVSTYSEKNKMTAANLATVFGPNILRPKNDTSQTAQLESPFVNKVAQVLIQFYDTLFVPKTNQPPVPALAVNSTAGNPALAKRPSVNINTNKVSMANSVSNSNLLSVTPTTPNSATSPEKKGHLGMHRIIIVMLIIKVQGRTKLFQNYKKILLRN